MLYAGLLLNLFFCDALFFALLVCLKKVLFLIKMLYPGHLVLLLGMPCQPFVLGQMFP